MSKNSFVKTSAEILAMFPAGTPVEILEKIRPNMTWCNYTREIGVIKWVAVYGNREFSVISEIESGLITHVGVWYFCSKTNQWVISPYTFLRR